MVGQLNCFNEVVQALGGANCLSSERIRGYLDKGVNAEFESALAGVRTGGGGLGRNVVFRYVRFLAKVAGSWLGCEVSSVTCEVSSDVGIL